MAIRFKLNGTAVAVDVPGDTPLLWAIRDTLKLTGTKFGCGIGQCGACTVHVEGVAVRSCITPVASIADAAVTTIEGLDPAGAHPLQKAWVAHQVPQCGYCQSGQIMQAAALLSQTTSVDDLAINSAMGGNLCRCMAYVRIRKAIKSAASEMQGARA
jgi:isoquinoline 1-oxidoreductase alpha subunit